MRRVHIVVLAGVLALAAGGCGNKAETDGGGGGASANWPTQDLRIMAPADPGGGWDSAARQMSEAITGAKVIDKGVEVYNVPGAGGTIGLSQFTSKQAGKDNELMVMGLVMIGAIETNDSPVDLSKTTPLSSLMSEPEAIVVRTQSPYKKLSDLVDAMKKDPSGFSFGGGSAGGTDQILVGLLAKEAGVDPSKPKYVAYSGGGEAMQSFLSGSVDAGVTGLSEVTEQVAAGKLRVLAVSSDKGLEVEGKQVPSIREEGLDVEITNWRGVVGPPEMKDGDREAAISAIQEMHDSQEWKDILEKEGLTDFFRTGDEFQSFIDSENTRVIGRAEGHRAHAVRRSFAGPRVAGAVLLAGSVAVFVAVFSIPGREGWSVSGPRFVPLIVAIGLVLLSAALPGPHRGAARHGAGRALGGGGRASRTGRRRRCCSRRWWPTRCCSSRSATSSRPRCSSCRWRGCSAAARWCATS